MVRRARWRSGNAGVCKTSMRGFDSLPRLHVNLASPDAGPRQNILPTMRTTFKKVKPSTRSPQGRFHLPRELLLPALILTSYLSLLSPPALASIYNRTPWPAVMKGLIEEEDNTNYQDAAHPCFRTQGRSFKVPISFRSSSPASLSTFTSPGSLRAGLIKTPSVCLSKTLTAKN